MACVAASLETNYEENSVDYDALPDDWFTDPVQLTEWQDKLVESCHEISQQLTEIQNDLVVDKTPAIPFRLVKAYTGI